MVALDKELRDASSDAEKLLEEFEVEMSGPGGRRVRVGLGMLRREKSPSMLLTNGDTASGAAAEAEVRSSCPTTRGGAPPR